MTAKESRLLNELISECWEKAEAAYKADDEIESAQYLKAHVYLMRFSNEIKKIKGGS